MKPLNRITLLLTTGDADGVGFEVTAKALLLLPASFFSSTSVCVFISKSFQKSYLKRLQKKFNVVLLSLPSAQFSESCLITPSEKKRRQTLFVVIAEDRPPDWIFNLSKVCQKSPDSMALVTGPLSKTLIVSSGYSAIGHTEILSQATGSMPLYMGFVGKYFNVILLTGHIPIKKVSSGLKNLNWQKTFQIIRSFVEKLGGAEKPMGLLALNPHAGEQGLISQGEDEFLKDKIAFLNSDSRFPIIEGPLVPDAAFLKTNWKRYSAYVCTYHDQGLIPFKTIHGQDSGVHVTLGLPFIRTSVDHGTAKAIFGKNLANPNSMKEAILLAKQLLKN